MISQFVSPYEHRLLGDLDFNFPPGTQAVGRLDDHSEGLLILTTDKTLTKKLLHPQKKHTRKYQVLVEGIVNEETLEKLINGLDILIKKRGTYKTQPCEVKLFDGSSIPERDPPLKLYKPHTWLEFTLMEGKNRQIRKMCKAVRHYCKRLIRISIEDLTLDGMKPGGVREIAQEELFKLLRL